MKTIYYTKTVSRRNKEVGYFKEGDFGEISIIELNNEAPLCFILTQNGKKTEIRQLGNIYLTPLYSLPFSREIDSTYLKKQGRFTEKVCKELGIRLRNQGEDNYYPARSYTYYLIGKKLFQEWCRKSELSITQCGNITFGNWWSLDVEQKHLGKRNIKFNIKRFNKEVEETKKWIDINNKGREKKIYFTVPKIKEINK